MLTLHIKVKRTTEPNRMDIHLSLSGNPAAEVSLRGIAIPPADGAGLAQQTFGAQLGAAIFSADKQAAGIFRTAAADRKNCRIEVAAGDGACDLPWEWLTGPVGFGNLAASFGAFVRVPAANVERIPVKMTANGEPVRTLLVIPRLGQDQPVHSLGMRWVRALCERCRGFFDLKVLRPATINELVDTLRQAKAEEKPYHLLHFDAPLGMTEAGEAVLLLEGWEQNQTQMLSGAALGKWMAENHVPLLSYYNPVLEQKDAARIGLVDGLAQAVLSAGVHGVTAFPFSMAVLSAAKFAGDIFAAMAQGETLSEGAAMGRRLLQANTEKEPGQPNLAPLPMIYESGGAVQLFPVPPVENAPLFRIVMLEEAAEKSPTRIDPRLLGKLPAAGFVGRDETFLALDRAFEDHPLVLLHGSEGMGKTAAAAAFARWVMDLGWTGEGAVLYSSFQNYQPLSHALETFGSIYKDAMKEFGVEWNSLAEAERRWTIIRVLQKMSVFWVWDDIESLMGSPSYPSPYTEKERENLLSFLKDATEQRGKFLLLSANAEEWMGDLPWRMKMPSLAYDDQVRLADVLLKQTDIRSENPDIHRLLQFGAGIPFAQKLMINKVPRMGQIEPYLADLSALREGFTGAESRKLAGAVLQYELNHEFTQQEVKILSLLGLFRSLVDVDVLRAMAKPGVEWRLAEMGDLSRDEGIALLDRAMQAGFLITGKGGYYTIPPSIAWFLKECFNRQFPTTEMQERARYAYAYATSGAGRFYTLQYASGSEEMLQLVQLEEGNLLHARELAHQHGWQSALMDTLQGLSLLYDRAGRRAAWEAIILQSTADFSDPESGDPLPGKELYWQEFNEFRVRLARLKHNHEEAAGLQRKRVALDRQAAEPSIHLKPSEMSEDARLVLRQLADSMYKLAEIEREGKDQACITTYVEASRLFRRLGEKKDAARCLYNLGLAYTNLPEYRNLTEAEKWYRQSMDLVPQEDASWQGRCLTQIATVTYERFLDGQKAKRSEEELVQVLNQGLEQYFDALDVIPEESLEDLATVYTMIGACYVHAGNMPEALKYYDEAIACKQSVGNIPGAADISFNVAIALFLDNRLQDGKQYAEEALRIYESLGSQATRQASKTRGLLVRFGFGKK